MFAVLKTGTGFMWAGSKSLLPDQQYDPCTMARVHPEETQPPRTKEWSTAMRDGVFTGTIASVLSTAALAICGRCENGSAHGPTNATSHWFWGDRAIREDRASARYTLVGYAIHHASATLWAVVYERLFGRLGDRRELLPAAASATLVSGAACLVDYRLTPPRLHPGFEKRLSVGSLALVYAAFGAGLLAGSLARSRTRREVDTMSA